MTDELHGVTRGKVGERKTSTLFGWPPSGTALAIGGAGCFAAVLLACCAASGLAFAFFGESHPAKFVGSWKGRFDFIGGSEDVVYTLNKDGSFKQESFDLDGRRTYQSEGRWGIRAGQLRIIWAGGDVERGTADWIDNDSFRYRIVEQNNENQVGHTTTFKRQ